MGAARRGRTMQCSPLGRVNSCTDASSICSCDRLVRGTARGKNMRCVPPSAWPPSWAAANTAGWWHCRIHRGSKALLKRAPHRPLLAFRPLLPAPHEQRMSPLPTWQIAVTLMALGRAQSWAVGWLPTLAHLCKRLDSAHKARDPTAGPALGSKRKWYNRALSPVTNIAYDWHMTALHMCMRYTGPLAQYWLRYRHGRGRRPVPPVRLPSPDCQARGVLSMLPASKALYHNAAAMPPPP